MTQTHPSKLQRMEKYIGFKLDVTVYKLILHVGVTHQAKRKKELTTGLRVLSHSIVST